MNPTIPRLFVLADSISMQYGPHLQTMLAGRIAYDRKRGPTQSMADLDVPKDDNGGDSSLCLLYLQGRHAEGGIPADILLLNCGLHDVKRLPPKRDLQVPLPQYQSNLRAIIPLVRKMQLQLVWARTTPVCEAHHNHDPNAIWRYQKDVDQYNHAADQIMAESKIPTIDLHSLTLTLGPMETQSGDGRHFITSTLQTQAAHIAGWLLRHTAAP